MQIFFIWIQFLGLACIIGLAGYHLSRYADVIAEKTGLGRNWIGLILLATITSLPELMSGISAVKFTDNPNLAVGDILGSCVFNLTLVFVLDWLHQGTSVYSKASAGHILSGAFGMILISFVGCALLLSPMFPNFSVGHVGGFALIIPAFYLLAMRNIYSFEKNNRNIPSTAIKSIGNKPSFKEVLLLFGVAAVFVIAAGAMLPFVGHRIVQNMGWSSAFVGTIFMALATSLPEIAVTISALRLRAVELAFSNVLGSNLFNVMILTVDDFFYGKAHLFNAVAPAHTITAFSAVMMTGLVLIALVHPPQKRIFNTVSILSVFLVAVFILNSFIIFRVGL